MAIEEAASAMEEAAAEARAEVAEAAERVERAIAERPKREASWMADRARELYKVGLLSEALAKAQQAISIDGGNIKAYWVAAQALEKQNREQEAVAYHRKKIMLLGIPEHRDRPRLFLKALQSLPKENISLLEQFSEKVFENATHWPAADRLEILREVVESAVLSHAERVMPFVFSNANERERPQLFLTLVPHLRIVSRLMLPQESLPWLDRFAQKVIDSAVSWAPHDCIEVVSKLIDFGRLGDAKHLTELTFSRADSTDQPQFFLIVLRRLAEESAPWLDHFAEKVLASAGTWTPQDCYEVIGQLIDSGRLNDAKRLAELVVPKADSLELEALLMEINDRLGVLSAESLREYLKKVRFDARSEILAPFLRIANSPGHFSPGVISLFKAEISQRYLQWKPEIDEQFRTQEAALKSSISEDRIKEYCRAQLLISPHNHDRGLQRH